MLCLVSLRKWGRGARRLSLHTKFLRVSTLEDFPGTKIANHQINTIQPIELAKSVLITGNHRVLIYSHTPPASKKTDLDEHTRTGKRSPGAAARETFHLRGHEMMVLQG